MPGFNVQVPHTLGVDEARNRIQKLLPDLIEQYGDRITDLEETWTNDSAKFSFKFMNFSVSGDLKIRSDSVAVEGNIPFGAMPFRGRIAQVIRDRAAVLLAP